MLAPSLRIVADTPRPRPTLTIPLAPATVPVDIDARRDLEAAYALLARMPKRRTARVPVGCGKKQTPRVRVPGTTSSILSVPGKMPCYGFSMTAGISCPFRSKAPDGPCVHCYADNRGNYGYPNVRRALERRFHWAVDACRSVEASDAWVARMVAAILDANGDTGYFRGHDSGDLFSPAYVRLWIRVARALPGIKFWFPTQSWSGPWAGVLREFAALPNVTLRPSGKHMDSPAPMLDGFAAGTAVLGPDAPDDCVDRICPAVLLQNGECRACRACWDAPDLSVGYPVHH